MEASNGNLSGEPRPGATSLDRLNDIGRRCLAGGTLSRDQLKWLGDSIAAFLDHSDKTIDEAMGLPARLGRAAWQRAQARRRRDAALRELAGRFYSHLNLSAQARTLRMLTIHYAAMGWRRDRQLTAPPPHYAGAPHEWLWRAFAAGAPLPMGERRLRTILLPPEGSAAGGEKSNLAEFPRRRNDDARRASGFGSDSGGGAEGGTWRHRHPEVRHP